MGINFHLIKNYIRHYFTATRKGHNVHSPFAYQLCEEVFYNKAAFYDFEKLNKLRKKLLKDEMILKIEDFGAGSKTFKKYDRKVSDIAAKGISSSEQSEILYKLVNFLKTGTIVELGTSLGLNALYLALSDNLGKVYSIEGSMALYDYAVRLAGKKEIKNLELINGKFDEQLPLLLNKIQTLDLFYVDGNHSFDATLNYFKMAIEKSGNDSVFIFDDIYWSEGMTGAWEEIKKDSRVTLTVDAFYFGFVFFKKEIKEKVHLKILI